MWAQQQMRGAVHLLGKLLKSNYVLKKKPKQNTNKNMFCILFNYHIHTKKLLSYIRCSAYQMGNLQG